MNRDERADVPFDGAGRLAKDRLPPRVRIPADHPLLLPPTPREGSEGLGGPEAPAPPLRPDAPLPPSVTSPSGGSSVSGPRGATLAGIAGLAIAVVAFGAYRLGASAPSPSGGVPGAPSAPEVTGSPAAPGVVGPATPGAAPEPPAAPRPRTLPGGDRPIERRFTEDLPKSAPEPPAPVVEESDPVSADPADASPAPADPPSSAGDPPQALAVEGALGPGWSRARDESDADGRRIRWSHAGDDAFLVLEFHREPGWSFPDLKRREEARLRAKAGYVYTFVRYRPGESGSRAAGIWNYRLRRGGASPMAKMLVGFPGVGAQAPILLHCSRDLTNDRSTPEGRAIVAAFDRAFDATNRAVAESASPGE